jgi:hypothetical protein
MPDYIVKSRITNAITETTVTANTRDEAVDQAVTAKAPDEQISVLNVSEVPVPPAAAADQQRLPPPRE